MNKKRCLLAVLAVVLGLSGAPLAAAQTTADLVYVPVAVTGAKNAYVNGLKKENFRLLEDGIEQTIVTFGAENQPMEIDIVLALGALQRGRATHDSTKIREAVENFRQQSNTGNKFTVEEMPFGANGIFDGISRHVTRLSGAANARKAVLVVTDGFETSGGDPGRALQEYAKKVNIPIHIVYAAPAGGQSDDLGEVVRGNQIFLSGGAIYEDLAKFTGGRLYQAEADTQLRAALEGLASEFKSQYLLGFKSTNDARDDKWRKLEVKIKPPEGMKDLKVKVRDRYFVAKVKK